MNPVITPDYLKSAVRNIPDFPIKGVQFKDITTLLQDPELFKFVIDETAAYYKNSGITKIVAIESRGFITGGAIAERLHAGFIPVRKPGKLPWKTYSKTYKLEYGEDTQEIHQDALNPDDVVLLHDDLLATGGTTLAALDLISKFGVKKVFINYVIELEFLNGRQKIGDKYDIFTLIKF